MSNNMKIPPSLLKKVSKVSINISEKNYNFKNDDDNDNPDSDSSKESIGNSSLNIIKNLEKEIRSKSSSKRFKQGKDPSDKAIIDEAQEKTLTRFLKINHLIEGKQIQQQIIKEEVTTTGKKPIIPTLIESDDEEDLLNVIKEIDKKKLVENPIYFYNGEIITYKASIKRVKKKKNHQASLHELNFRLKRKAWNTNEEDFEEDNEREESAQMDLDEFYKRMEKQTKKIKIQEEEKCFIY